MIIVDRLTHRGAVLYRRPVASAHLLSTLPGAEGTAELLAFATGLGLQERWIQFRGEPKEHFDLMGPAKHQAAIDAGAELVASRELVAVIREKRGSR